MSLKEIANLYKLKQYNTIKIILNRKKVKIRTISEANKVHFQQHPERRKYYSKMASGNNNYFWRGGIKVDKSGYILIYSPDHPYNVDNYVREHRLVMEKYLKRYLKIDEIVHHLDGDKSNNKLTNLKLMTISEHRKLHISNVKRDDLGKFVATPISNDSDKTSEYAGNSDNSDNQQGSRN